MLLQLMLRDGPGWDFRSGRAGAAAARSRRGSDPAGSLRVVVQESPFMVWFIPCAGCGLLGLLEPFLGPCFLGSLAQDVTFS